ncbi:MAG: hypothetical protein NTV52_05135 [Acidobacteria bacterium]|nr:hypothetical protein [Acidobacteriota bacterium]
MPLGLPRQPSLKLALQQRTTEKESNDCYPHRRTRIPAFNPSVLRCTPVTGRPNAQDTPHLPRTLPPAALAALQLTYANLPPGQACCLVPDPQGNLYVIGTNQSNVSITKLDAAHRIVATFQFGGGNLDQPIAATLDAQGNLIIVGQTNSADFPLRNPLFSPIASPRPIGFLARLDPNTGQLLSSTRIGGDGITSLQAVTTEPSGNI